MRGVLRDAVRGRMEAGVAALEAADFRLEPARWCEFEIVGESHYQRALARIAGRDPEGVNHHCEAILIPEPTNPHDPNAVLVTIAGRPVGYLRRDDAFDYTDQLAAMGRTGQTARCPAYICGGFVDADGRRAFYGVKLGLSWPIAVEGPGEHGPAVSTGAVARLQGRIMSEEEAWHAPPVQVADDADLSRAFPEGILGREIAFAGWSDDRLPYLRSVSVALGLHVADPPGPGLELLCVGPRARSLDVLHARAAAPRVMVISGAQLQQLMS
jgi:hypothetical protein